MPRRTIPPVAILAGGLATRLRPVTATVPKALIPVAGEPFIDHQLRLLGRERVLEVVLCLGHLGDMVRDHVGDGRRFDLHVAYSFDGVAPLGTGGALRRALPLLGEAFFVLYGDSYLDIAFAPIADEFHRSGAPALMTVFANEGRWDTSNVVFDGSRVTRYDKRAPTPDMRYIDYGLGILTPATLARAGPAEAFDLADVYATLAAAGLLAGHEVTRRFYEIGTHRGLGETDAYLRAMRYGR
jgi:NDP-sugar pyrophosphorylase family protein